jgi:hypothetical protein
MRSAESSPISGAREHILVHLHLRERGEDANVRRNAAAQTVKGSVESAARRV